MTPNPLTYKSIAIATDRQLVEAMLDYAEIPWSTLPYAHVVRVAAGSPGAYVEFLFRANGALWNVAAYT